GQPRRSSGCGGSSDRPPQGSYPSSWCPPCRSEASSPPPERNSAVPDRLLIPDPQVMTPPSNHHPHLAMGTTPRPELPIPFPRRRPWVPASPRRRHGMTTAPSPEGMRGRGDPVCSVERHAQRVLDGADGLDLVVGALGTAAADDLQDVRGHPATVDDGVSGGLDHGGTPGLGV